jgi:hypothetical protein
MAGGAARPTVLRRLSRTLPKMHQSVGIGELAGFAHHFKLQQRGRKQEINMAHQTPLEAIAAAIESANIDFPDAGDGTTWAHIYRSTEECNHLARAVVSGLEKWGYSIVPSTGAGKA